MKASRKKSLTRRLRSSNKELADRKRVIQSHDLDMIPIARYVAVICQYWGKLNESRKT